jgi:hypothetical protein
MTTELEEERRRRMQADGMIKTLKREQYAAREYKRRTREQIAAYEELFRRFAVELNKRCADQVGKEQYWAVAWLDAHGKEQNEFFPEEQRHVAETLYDRLDATGVQTIKMTLTFVVKDKRER